MCEFLYGIERNELNEKPKSTDKTYCETIQDKEEKLVATMSESPLSSHADCMFLSCNWLTILWC